jgi:hypothetical protein
MEGGLFEKKVISPLPPTATGLARGASSRNDAWKKFTSNAALQNCRTFCRASNAKEIAAMLTGDDIEKARDIVIEIIEWCDEFEQHLKAEQETGK